jgi:hypothetical protein
MGKASRLKINSRHRKKNVEDLREGGPTITGTDSEGGIHQITGAELVRRIMKGNTRRFNFTDEGDWTSFERVDDFAGDMVFVNSRYTVFIREIKWNEDTEEESDGLHLSIKRNDKEVMDSPDDWRDKMRIKNELAGDECEAVELYPAMSRLTDTANQYHLWCLAPGKKFPVGFNKRVVEDETTFGDVERKQVLNSVVDECKRRGVPFDPVNNIAHKTLQDAYTSTTVRPKQRQCPSWMKAGGSRFRFSSLEFFKRWALSRRTS